MGPNRPPPAPRTPPAPPPPPPAPPPPDPRRRFLASLRHVDPLDPRRRRPFAAARDHRLDLRRIPLDEHLPAAVAAVPDPASKPERPRGRHAPAAVEDALHPTVDAQAAGHAHPGS